MANILVVEDDANMRILLNARLKSRYTVLLAKDGKEALDIYDGGNVNLIITDIMMPAMDGYTLVEILRGRGETVPVIMLTAKDGMSDKCRGFSVGTDDYMTKPVDEEELILRIRALLRRARIASERRLVIGSTELNYDALTVKCGDTSQVLPQKEFQLLYQLLSYPNKIFTRLQLLEEIWGPASDSMESTVSVHINRLRKRFDQNPDFQIVTIRGLGYKAQILEAES